MTVVTKLRLNGFKSFPRLTEIPFEKDFSIVIGPNGSGKSNLIDAFCFVLGKTSSKSLRAEKSSNLIFNGGKKGKAAKDAEVSIYFSNDRNEFPIQEKNVKITRIVKSSGNSIYKINDKPRTRQQVIDLLNAARIDPDGHNIVLQGDIVKFTEMRSEDRRKLVEEIAGISVYEDKKEKALSELDKVSGKLNEAEIILTEREANLRELKKDRDEAKKFNEIKDQIKNNKATILDLRIKEKNTKKEIIDKELNDLSKKIDSHNLGIEDIRKQIDLNKKRIIEINNQVELKGEKEQLVLRKNIEDIKENIIKRTSRIDVLKNELKKISERKIQLKNNIDELNKQIQEIKTKKKEISEKIKFLSSDDKKKVDEIEQYRRKHGVSELSTNQNKIIQIDVEIEGIITEKEKMILQEQDLSREQVTLELRVQDHERKLVESNKLEKEDKENLRILANLREDFKKLITELVKRSNDDSVMSSQLSASRRQLVGKNEELAILRSKNLGIKEHFSQDIAVKKILETRDKEVYGILSALGTISTKFSLALEVAAGQRMKSVVVSNDIVAEKYIKKLKEEKLGVVTFLPLNKIRSRKTENLLRIPGVYGLADTLIKYDTMFSNVFSYIFGSTLVVEDIQTARKVGIGKARMVTLDGTLLEPSGAIVGGFRRPSGLGFSQKEVNENIKVLDNEVDRLTKLINLLEDKKIKNESEIIKVRENKYDLESQIVKLESLTQNKLDSYALESELNSLKKELNIVVSKKTTFVDKIKMLDQNTLSLKDKKRNLTELLIKKPEVSQYLNVLEQQLSQIRDNLMGLKGELLNYDNQVEKIFTPEIERTQKIINDLDKEREQFQKELEDNLKVQKNNKVELETKEKEEQKFHGIFRNLIIERNKLNDILQNKEKLIFQEETKIKSLQIKINELNINIAKIKAEVEGINREFEEYKDGKIRRGVAIEDLAMEIKAFDREILKIGNVNLRSLEVYDQLETEHKGLLEKVLKLKLEKDDVLNLISEIESKKKDIFLITLKKIEKNFKDIFASLSSKGEAFLELEDEENPFNGGVDIKVKIVGNKYMDIKSLSGGEKTLTALGFIFAIQEIEPASFYLFDEVDAALDKHNSEKLANLISKYANKAQYIVISHNDSIITGAQQIYGVSMQEGISKIVSLKV